MERKDCACEIPSNETSFAEIDNDEDLAILAKALGHPARVRIIRLLLARRECICGEICDEIALAQSTTSQHLKVLKQAGLIVGEISGPKTCYCINDKRLSQLKALVSGLVRAPETTETD